MLSDGGAEIVLAFGLLVASLVYQEHWYSWSTVSAVILFAAVVVARVSGPRAAIMVSCCLFSLIVDPDAWLGAGLYQGFLVVELLAFLGRFRAAYYCAFVVFVWFLLEGPEETNVYGLTLNVYFALAGLSISILVAKLRRQMGVEKENARLESLVSQSLLREELVTQVHDTVAQSLARVVLRAERLKQMHPQNDVSGEAGKIADAARSSLENVQHLMKNSQGSVAAAEGETLDDILRYQTSLLEAAGLTSAVVLEGTPEDLTPDSLALLSIVLREAVLNAAKHSPDGAHVRIDVDFGSTVFLHIVNPLDHTRPQVARVAGTNLGLTGMKQHVAQAGGSVSVVATGTEWRVAATLPGRLGEAPR